VPDNEIADTEIIRSQAGMTLPSLETASFWANVAVVALTALAAIAGVIALYFATRLGAAKDEALTRFQTESAVKVAQANEGAAKANETAAAANERAGRADERASRLEVEAAQQRARAAEAERALLELQQRLAPRRIDSALQKKLVAALRPYHGSVVVLTQLGDAEAAQFANDLIKVFQEAGWQLQLNRIGVASPPPYGLVCSIDVRRLRGRS
jgi:hypothetical protein